MAPRDVKAVGDYGEQIIKAIESTKIMVLVLSTNSNTSKFVKNEVERAFSKGKTVITFKIHEVEPSKALELFIASAHWIDAWNPPLESKVKVLADTILQYIGGESIPHIQPNQPIQPAPKATHAVKIPAPAITPDLPPPSKPTPAVSPTPAVMIPSGEKTFTNSIGMEFVLIPAGEFDMGSPENEEGRNINEGPVHRVIIRNPFYMGKYKVTQKQWIEVMGYNPIPAYSEDFKGENRPVVYMQWNDVQEFIKKLNRKEGRKNYRLPSEAEWEYAARAGTTTKYSFGDDDSQIGDFAWYDENSGSHTHDVGQKKPNPWGLYDMHGNVMDWVQDEWHDKYNGAPTDGCSWERVGDSKNEGLPVSRVSRGSSSNSNAMKCRSAHREDFWGISLGQGFRLVKVL